MTLEKLLRPYALVLKDRLGGSLTWGYYSTIEQARWEWTEIAGRSKDQELCTFEVLDDGRIVYMGSYVTDEC